jgi:hypothetical protein
LILPYLHTINFFYNLLFYHCNIFFFAIHWLYIALLSFTISLSIFTIFFCKSLFLHFITFFYFLSYFLLNPKSLLLHFIVLTLRYFLLQFIVLSLQYFFLQFIALTFHYFLLLFFFIFVKSKELTFTFHCSYIALLFTIHWSYIKFSFFCKSLLLHWVVARTWVPLRAAGICRSGQTPTRRLATWGRTVRREQKWLESFFLFVCLCVCLFVCLYVCMFVSLLVSLLVSLFRWFWWKIRNWAKITNLVRFSCCRYFIAMDFKI